MFKYVRFTPVPLAYTTLTFLGGSETVKVNYFDKPFVSIEAQNEEDINALILSQPADIGCTEITKDEFVQLVKTTRQYQRIIEQGNIQLEKLTQQIAQKYPQKERDTWHIQLAEALKYKQTLNDADAPFLKILADNEADTVDAFADAVINNNNAFIALTANALSEKRRVEHELLTALGA